MPEPRDLQLDGWHFKVRQPEGEGPHPAIFLIHGWTGDERSMWVFSNRFPKDALLIAPRAPYLSTHPEFGGYSWVEQRVEGFSPLAAFQPAVAAFEELLPSLETELDADLSRFCLAGFSQGAAFCFAYALAHPDRVQRLAALAGFLPEGSEGRLDALAAKPIFIAHGTEDEMVPLSYAQRAREHLAAAGVDLRYCEAETGHKLGANCARELADFFSA